MLIILFIIVISIFINYYIPNFFISIFESFGSFLILLLVSAFGGYFISTVFSMLGFPYNVFWYAMIIVGYLFYKDVKNND